MDQPGLTQQWCWLMGSGQQAVTDPGNSSLATEILNNLSISFFLEERIQMHHYFRF
jgi:hypothetical protein